MIREARVRPTECRRHAAPPHGFVPATRRPRRVVPTALAHGRQSRVPATPLSTPHIAPGTSGLAQYGPRRLGRPPALLRFQPTIERRGPHSRHHCVPSIYLRAGGPIPWRL